MCVCVENPHGFESTINPAKEVLGQAQKAPHNQDNVGAFKDALQRHYLWLFISLSFSFLFFVPGSELNATFTSKSEFH